MAVDVRWRDEADPRWLAEVISTETDEESILIGHNGRIALKAGGYIITLWDGFAEEPDVGGSDDDEFEIEEEPKLDGQEEET